MHHPRGAIYRPSHLRDTATLLSDFDNTEVETEELVREVQHGKIFQANDATATKCADSKIYSL